MTREAKIGMLTGLGVIVLIGVLLSQYLGDRNTGPSLAAGATGRMAVLPVGEGYRQQVLAPVGVPAMTPAGGGARKQLAGGAEVATPIATGGAGMPPAMLAADATGAAGGTGGVVAAGPSVAGPVVPVAAGPTLMDTGSEGGPPIITLADLTVPVKASTTDALLRPGVAGAAPAPATAVTAIIPTSAAPAATYTIVSGDTLVKIAKKVYNSTKNSDVQRIVAANPGMLKDATTKLVVNKKLVIPGMPAAPAPTVAVTPAVPAAPKPADPGMVYLPSGVGAGGGVTVPPLIQPPKTGGGSSVVVPKADAVKSAKAGTYVVQSGDTLEKIARKISPSKTVETVQKLASLNGIKDPKSLKVGQTLKLPAVS